MPWGIEVHQFTQVTGMDVQDRKVVRIRTTRGDVSAGAVLNATAGSATTISDMVGVSLPIVSQPLQACVTELIEPFLNYVIVSSNLHVYVNQSDKGELVIGAEIDPYQSYCDARRCQRWNRCRPTRWSCFLNCTA